MRVFRNESFHKGASLEILEGKCCVEKNVFGEEFLNRIVGEEFLWGRIFK